MNKKINLFITNSCNRTCSFCFLKEYTQQLKHEMSMEYIDQLVYWAKANQVDQIQLAGGEPTLHSRFEEIVKRFIEGGFQVSVLTNGIVRDKILDLPYGDQIKWHVNVNQFDTYTSHEFQQLEQMIARYNTTDSESLRLGASVSRIYKFGILITVQQLGEDWDWVLQWVRRYGIYRVRIDYARPSSTKDNEYTSFVEMEQDIQNLKNLIVELEKHRVFFTFDCPLPTCLFTTEEYIYYSVRNNLTGCCYPHFDIFEDGSVHYCASLKDQLFYPNLFEYRYEEIDHLFREQVNRIRQEKGDEGCKGCIHSSEHCQKLCLSIK